jgi:hypothetical protein
MCDISTINVRFYQLEVPYSHQYYRITPLIIKGIKQKHSLYPFLILEEINSQYFCSLLNLLFFILMFF